jgi:large subunit ribosomal protein L5e
MRAIAEDDEKKEAVKSQFKRLIDAGIGPDNLEALYAAAHKAIRADPSKKREATDLGYFGKRKAPKDPKAVYPKKQWKLTRRSVEQRKATIRQKLVAKGVVPVSQQEK